MADEPVSPELVLIDPELAVRLRATGPVKDCLSPRPRAAAPPSPAPAGRRRLAATLRTTVLVVSLAINAVLLGAAWSDGIGPSAPPTVPAGLHVTGTVPEIGDAAHSKTTTRASGAGAQQPPCHPSTAAAPSGAAAPGCPPQRTAG
jgi:hypothetical protein